LRGLRTWKGEEIHRTVVTIEELRSIPGTFGDPVRALQTLPGVARPNIAEGSLVVRGAEGLNTAYLVDGMPVPYMFHTLVGRSVVTPGFIDQVDFFPGGMPSRYGEVTQAVVNVRTDTRPVGRTRGHIGVDTLDGTASFEHRINDKWLVPDVGDTIVVCREDEDYTNVFWINTTVPPDPPYTFDDSLNTTFGGNVTIPDGNLSVTDTATIGTLTLDSAPATAWTDANIVLAGQIFG
jgi:hypothetical protein